MAQEPNHAKVNIEKVTFGKQADQTFTFNTFE